MRMLKDTQMPEDFTLTLNKRSNESHGVKVVFQRENKTWRTTMATQTPLIDQQELLDAAEATMFGMDNLGFCIACGGEHFGCEPDARNYECEECGEHQVYGAPELVLMGYAG